MSNFVFDALRSGLAVASVRRSKVCCVKFLVALLRKAPQTVLQKSEIDLEIKSREGTAKPPAKAIPEAIIPLETEVDFFVSARAGVKGSLWRLTTPYSADCFPHFTFLTLNQAPPFK